MAPDAPSLLKPSGRFIPALDGLRALSIAAVVVHATAKVAHAGPLERLFIFIESAGWVGVQLFFVLSGFLITGILLDTKDSPHFFRNFYARRALRIFPPYYATLAVALLVAPFFLPATAGGVKRILADQAWLWTYGSNIAIYLHNGWMWSSEWLSLDHTWSLSVEEQFYLVWPLLVFALSARRLAVLSVLLFVSSPFIRAWMRFRGVSPEVVYSFTLSRVDALAVGALIALLVRRQAEPRSSPSVTLVTPLLLGTGGVLLVVVCLLARGLSSEAFVVQTAGFSALALLFGGVVLSAVTAREGGRVSRLLGAKPLRFVGKYSYGIYLYQGVLTPLFREVPVERLAASLHSGLLAMLVETAISLGVSTGVAYASFHLFEKRLLAYKDRFAR